MLSGIEVKGSIAHYTLKYLNREHDQTVIDNIYAAMSKPAVQAIKTVLVGNAIPIEYVMELLHAIRKVLGGDDPNINFKVGLESFKLAFSLVYKVFIRLGNPHFILNKTAKVWRNFNNAGTLECIDEGKNKAIFRLKDFDFKDTEYCEQRLRGGFQAVLELCGCKVKSCTHTYCTSRGDPHCEWELIW